jgi:arylsulfatase A-like enzyme
MLIALFCFMCTGCAATGEQAAEPPNVLFIAVDDLNDWVGYLGGNAQSHTPNIDALAERGFAFKYAYCPAPACGPSRTALMYGVAPYKSGSYGHHASYDPKQLLDESQLPMNLVFQNNGYYTAGCGKIFHYPEPRGWDVYQRGFGGKRAEQVAAPGKGVRIKTGIIETDNDSETGEGKAADWTIAQLEQVHDKPFFIAMGLYQPHEPWVSPKKYYDRFPLESVKLPRVPEGDLDDVPEAGQVFARNLVGFRHWDDHKEITAVEGAWRKLVRGYLASCSFSDSNVGRVLDALAKSEHADNTIIVLWGDHGWHLGEKEAWRKMTLWERGTRTPLIIKLPGDHEPRLIDEPVTLQDLYPTLVDLCGLAIDQPLDGDSLKPLMQARGEKSERAVLMSHGPGNFAVRQGRYRLIRYADGSEELYDVVSDPQEWENLAAKPGYGSVAAALRQQLPKTWKYVIGPRFKWFEDSFAEPQN